MFRGGAINSARTAAAEGGCAVLHAWMPFEAFEKAGASAAKRLRIRGVISTEHRDRHGELVKQDGLDFGPILAGYGWLNDGHDSRSGAELGIPERIYRVTVPGPDGKPIKATAMEGYLLDTPRGRAIWENSKALRGTGRSLGFSVEGGVLERACGCSARNPGAMCLNPTAHKDVERALVKQIAITRVPVNPHTTLEPLAKSLDATMRAVWAKAMSVGYPTQVPGMGAPGALGPTVPQGWTRPTVQVFDGVPFDWEAFNQTGSSRAAVQSARGGRTLTKGEAEAFIRARLPNASTAQVRALLDRAAI